MPSRLTCHDMSRYNSIVLRRDVNCNTSSGNSFKASLPKNGIEQSSFSLLISNDNPLLVRVEFIATTCSMARRWGDNIQAGRPEIEPFCRALTFPELDLKIADIA